MAKKNPKHFSFALANATEEEKDELKQVMAKFMVNMKPLLTAHHAAEVEAKDYMSATGEDKTLDEITPYATQHPLSPLASAIVSAEANKGSKFKTKKPKGSQSKRTQHIYKLAKDNPDKSPKELLKIKGVREAIGTMADGTFSNHVTGARKTKS